MMAHESTRPVLRFTGFCAMLGLAAGCHSPQTRVAERVRALEQDWRTNLLYQESLPERVLDWPAALAQLRASNLKLRQARLDLTNAQESVRQVYRDLVPTLNLNAGVSKRLVDMPHISPSDVTFSVDSFFNIPGVVSFNARLYVARLYEIRTEAAYALAEREQIIELYKLFWAFQDAQEQAHTLQNQKKTAHAYEAADPVTGQLLLTEAELREISGENETQNLQQRASELLGSHEYHWSLSTNRLPELHYAQEPLPLDDTNRVAQLQIRLAAIELEAARAELAGIKLRYWPELNIFITGPPIYQQYYGQEQFWNAHDVQASANVFWWVDTRGYISHQLRQTKRQKDLQEARLRQDALALIQRLLATQELLRVTRERERDLEQQLVVLAAIPPAQNFAALQRYATDYQTTADQLRQVRRELAELNTLCWFMDESAWTELAPLTPLVAIH
jgi:hypothetical protein